MDQPANTAVETTRQHFDRVLSREPFKGLKAVLDRVSTDQEALRAAVRGANSYEDLLIRLGYQITLTKQIHLQDSYSRVGAAGGIKAVLPYYDIPTQSSLPTLIHFDSTVTTTAESAAFFNQMLRVLKTQLSGQN
jgi:hypothetical protein